MTQTLRIAFAALALPLGVAACNGSSSPTATEDAGGSDKTAHGDECVTDSCTLFIMMPGKLDMTPVTK